MTETAMPSDDGPLYADGPSTEVAVDVDASPEDVWSLVSDIELPARFSAEFQGADWLDPDAPRVGARFVGRSRHDALGSWETTCTVVELQERRRFAYAVGDPAEPTAVWRFTLEPLAAGGTRLTQWVRLGPGRSGLSLAIERMPDKERKIVARRLREHQQNMRLTCEGIKQLAEAQSAGEAGRA